MKKSITLTLTLTFLLSMNALAQGWKWATGSSCPQIACEGFHVAADKKGNTYAIGMAEAIGSSLPAVVQSVYGPFTIIDSGNYAQQGIIVSLDSNGHYRWALGTQNSRVWLYQVRTDDSGNVYVLGDAFSPSHFNIGSHYFSGDYFIMKMDGLGNIAWIRPVPYYTTDFQVSHSGSIYVAGGNIFYAKYDKYLNSVWTQSITADTTVYFGGMNITTDSQIYVAGTFYSDTLHIGTAALVNKAAPDDHRAFLAKFDATGNPVWARSPYSDSTMDVYGIAVDPANDAYIAGSYHGGIKFASDSLYLPGFLGLTYTFKYDHNGNPKWARSVREPNFYAPNDIIADNCGNVWLCGRMPFNYLEDSMFMIQYDTAGHIWDTVKVSSGGDDQAGLAVDGKGNLFVCGDYYNNTIVGGTLLPKDSSLEALFVWKYQYGFPDCTRDTIPFTYTISGAANMPVKTDHIFVFPNPNPGTFTITGETDFLENATAELFDLSGRLVNKYRVPHDNTEINLDDVAPGLYQLRVISTTGRAVMIKVVVIK